MISIRLIKNIASDLKFNIDIKLINSFRFFLFSFNLTPGRYLRMHN